MKPQIVSAEAAVSLIKDKSCLCIGGAGAGHAVPDLLIASLAERYQQTNHPAGLTTLHPCGIGDNDQRGMNYLALEGLIDTNIGGFWGNSPKLLGLAKSNKIKGYNFPQGVLEHLVRASAGAEDGLLTKTGLHTFVDPRYEGGKINSITTEDRVELVTLNGKEYLFYKSFKIDVAFIRGSSVDADGNLTMEEEVGTFSMLSMAQAAKTNGGIVIAQVKKATGDHVPPIQVKVPGVLIDYVVLEPNQQMTFITSFEPAFISRKASYTKENLSLEGIKRVIARRAARELKKDDFVNLGYGLPDGVPIVATEEGFVDKVVFMIEQGQIDGITSTGLNFGAMYNPGAIIDDGYQFDFFHGGGLNICFLGFAQVDRQGNVNSSRFGEVLTGCGGFIDISQHTRKVVFCGAFATKSEIMVQEGKLKIGHPGKVKKMVNQVQQITFNGDLGRRKKQEVLYVTERAVFRLAEEGIRLMEIAPGVDLERDILQLMDFQPIIEGEPKLMAEAIFSDLTMNLTL